MKKTVLKGVYCKPQAEGQDLNIIEHDRKHLYMNKRDEIFYVDNISKAVFWTSSGKQEIPVSHFIDLLEDKIVGWRLEEIGFEKEEDSNAYFLKDPQTICVGIYSDETLDVSIHYDYASIPTSIKTFTELETLIGFLK